MLGPTRVDLNGSESELGKLLHQIEVLEEEAFEPCTMEILGFPDSKQIHSHQYLPRKTVVIRSGWFDFRTGVAGVGKFALTQSKTNIPRAGLVLPVHISKTRLFTDSAICVGMVRWNYYHWLIEELPALLRAIKAAPEARVFLGHDAPRYVLDTLDFLDIPFSLSRGRWRFDALVLATRNIDPGWPHPADIEILKEAFERPSLATKPIAIFASRVLASRKLANEEEISDWLGRFGVNPVFFERMSFFEQVSTMRTCDVIVGNHGAGLTNILFMPEGSRVVEIVQTLRPCFEVLARVLGHNYQRVYAEKSRFGRYSGEPRDIESALASIESPS